MFEKLAELWRKKNPAEMLLSRSYMALVNSKSEIEGAMVKAIEQFARAMRDTTSSYVMAGRTPHVLGMFDVTPAIMAMPGHIADKVFRGKHKDEFFGMTPDDLVRAMYRPAMVFSDLSEDGNMTLVTNIITPLGPVLVNVQTNGNVNGKSVAIIKSVYTKEKGVLAKWVRGEDATRKLLYADKFQAPEAITGRLNPENKNPAFKGRDLLAMEPINALGSNNRGATDSTSNKQIVPKYGAPVNENYSGWDTVAPTLQAKWDGAKIKGLPQPRLKDYGSLLAWIDKQYKGDPADKPMLSRAPANTSQTSQDPATRAETIIQTNAASRAPLDALARGLTQITVQHRPLCIRLVFDTERARSGVWHQVEFSRSD